METNIIVSWSIAIFIIAFLGVFLNLRAKNREKRTLSAILSFAQENSCTISSYDSWDNTLIGIDSGESKSLFFIRKTPDKEEKVLITLSEVVGCRLVRTERSVRYKSENIKVIDVIALVFSFRDKHKPDLTLEFYNNDYDSLTLMGELQLAQKWSGLIQCILLTNMANKPAKSSLINPKRHASTAAYPRQRKIRNPAQEAQAV